MSDDFAPVLRRLRRAAALTQEELADASGLSVEGISALERGQRRRPHAHTVDLLVTGLGLDEAAADQLRVAARPSRGRSARAAEPARSRLSVVPRQLLVPPATYVGRDTQVDGLVDALSEPLARATPEIMAISGMGGVGKSSLALLVAHRVAEHYPDGQIYLDLRGQGEGEPMSRTEALAYLLSSLGVRDADMLGDPGLAAAQLRTITSGARLLLVLDNAAGPEQVEPLLPAAPASAAIITSRRRFGGLWDHDHVPLTLLDENDARRLLDELAGAERLAAEADASRTLVQVCAGLPLALRLVAARLDARPSWSVAAIADRVGADPAQLAGLGGGSVDVAGTLVGSIDQLATSADPGDHDAAAAMHIVGLLPRPSVSPVAVAAACGWDRERAERAIERLVEVSLVEELVPGRYRAHDLVHASAAERALGESGTQAVRAVRSRVLATYRGIGWRSRDLARPVPDGLDAQALIESNDPTTDPVECIDLIARDIDQILALAKDVVTYGGEDTRLAAHAVLGLISYYVSRVDSAGWRGLLELVLSELPPEAVDERLALHLDLALFHAVRGQAESTWEHSDRVIAMARAEGRTSAEIAAHSASAMASRQVGDLDEADRSCRRALSLARDSGDDRAVAAAYRDLGLVRFGHDPVAGLEAEHEALRLYRGLDVPRGVAMALVNVGVMLRDVGRLAEAQGHLEEAVALAHELTDRALEAEALDELGYWHVLSGEPGRGLQVLTDGLALVDVRGGNWGEASIRHRLGLALHGLGRTDEADQHWEIAIRLHEQRGDHEAAAELRQSLRSREVDPTR